MENPSRLRWGLVGTGGFAAAVFAPALRNAGQELLGAAGSSPQGSAAFAVRHGVPRTYASLESMLRDSDVDAVWIASPNHLHWTRVRTAASLVRLDWLSWTVTTCRRLRFRKCVARNMRTSTVIATI